MNSSDIDRLFTLVDGFQQDCKRILDIHNRYCCVIEYVFVTSKNNTNTDEIKHNSTTTDETKYNSANTDITDNIYINTRQLPTQRHLRPISRQSIQRQPISRPRQPISRQPISISRQPVSISRQQSSILNETKTRSSLQSPVSLYNRLYNECFDSKNSSISDEELNELSERSQYILNNLDTDLTPVIVKPTKFEIELATQKSKFTDIKQPLNDVCPIDKDIFLRNDDVIMIRQCRHIFRVDNLLRWFENNCRCPVCRFDVREAYQYLFK